MRKLRYTIYDTAAKKYLERAEQPLGNERQLATQWTRHPERAQRFPGIKSADAMLEKLGRYSEFIIINGRGEIVG